MSMPETKRTSSYGYGQFEIGQPQKLPASEMQRIDMPGSPVSLVGGQMETPVSVKALQAVGPGEGHETRIGAEIKMEQNDDANEEAMRRARIEFEDRMHQLTGGGKEGEYENPYDAREGYIGSLIKDLRNLAKEKSEPEREKIRERLAENRLRVYQTSLDELETINRYLEGLKNPYPYDSRWSIQLFDTILKTINTTLREKRTTDAEGKEKGRGLDKEGKAFLKMMKADMLWAMSFARVNEAMGPAYELYYDGELELSRLRSVHTELLAGDFSKVFKKEIDGLHITPEERALTQKIISKTPDAYMDGDERYKSLKEKSLREVSIEYQDAYDKWSLDSIAATQKNLEYGFGVDKNGKPLDTEQGDHYKPVDPLTFNFLNKLFDPKGASGGEDIVYINKNGEKFKVRSQLLNPYCMPRDDDYAYKAYYTRMHELVVGDKEYRNALDRIKSGLANKSIDSAQAEAEVNALVEKIITKADARVEKWESLDENNPFDRVAGIAIKGMINLEKGKLVSGELGWGWAYEKTPLTKLVEGMERKDAQAYIDENRAKIQGPSGSEFIVIRKSELGSIYHNHDVTTVVFWARHIIDYDMLAETRGSILPPTIGAYRNKWISEPPYYRPDLMEFAKDDDVLLKRLGLVGDEGILSPGNKMENRLARKVYMQGKVGLQEQTYGKVDEGVKKYIRNNVWAYMTPFLNDPNKGDYYLTTPVFLPTFIADINFDRALCLEAPGARARDYPNKSVWHERLSGKSISDLKWENMDKYKYNWALVTNEQMERWLGPWVTPAAFNRATKEEFEKHTSMPGGMAEKESGKRFRLGGRGGTVMEGILRATVGAQSKVWAAVSGSGVMGKEPDNWPDTLSIKSEELKLLLDNFRKVWIAPWVNTELDMPATVRGVKNYSGTAAQLLIISYQQARRIVASAIVNSYRQSADVNFSMSELDK